MDSKLILCIWFLDMLVLKGCWGIVWVMFVDVLLICDFLEEGNGVLMEVVVFEIDGFFLVVFVLMILGGFLII